MNASRLRPIARRLTPRQRRLRSDKILRRADEREAARLLERARSRRSKKETK